MRGNMRIAVCDDDKLMLDQVACEVDREVRKYRESFVLDRFQSAVLFRNRFEREPYDIVILDIMMPKIDGFTLAEEMRKIRGDTFIIFLSQQEDLVFRSFDYKPYWFIPKERFREEIPGVAARFVRDYESRNVFIDIGEDEARPVRKDSVYYIECNAHKLWIKMELDTIVRYGTLAKLEKRLGDSGFMRIHKNYLVNVDKIQYMDKDCVVLENGERIALSKYKRDMLKDRLFKSGK